MAREQLVIPLGYGLPHSPHRSLPETSATPVGDIVAPIGHDPRPTGLWLLIFFLWTFWPGEVGLSVASPRPAPPLTVLRLPPWLPCLPPRFPGSPCARAPADLMWLLRAMTRVATSMMALATAALGLARPADPDKCSSYSPYVIGRVNLFPTCFPNSPCFELAICRCLAAEEIARPARLLQPDWMAAVDWPTRTLLP